MHRPTSRAPSPSSPSSGDESNFTSSSTVCSYATAVTNTVESTAAGRNPDVRSAGGSEAGFSGGGRKEIKRMKRDALPNLADKSFSTFNDFEHHKVNHSRKIQQQSTPRRSLPIRKSMNKFDEIEIGHLSDNSGSDQDEVDLVQEDAAKSAPVRLLTPVVLIEKLSSFSSTFSSSPSPPSSSARAEFRPGCTSSPITGTMGLEEPQPSETQERKPKVERDRKPAGIYASQGIDTKSLEAWLKKTQDYVLELERSKDELERRWEEEKACSKALVMVVNEKNTEITKLASKLDHMCKLVDAIAQQKEELIKE